MAEFKKVYGDDGAELIAKNERLTRGIQVDTDQIA